jgi:Na+-driven multidrug efflux pump
MIKLPNDILKNVLLVALIISTLFFMVYAVICSYILFYYFRDNEYLRESDGSYMILTGITMFAFLIFICALKLYSRDAKKAAEII